MRLLPSLKRVAAEIFGLFVDDGSFALTILAWLAVVALVLTRLDISRAWLGVILFGGLAVILVESAIRGARR